MESELDNAGLRICLVSSLVIRKLGEEGQRIFLSNFLSLLKPISKEIFVITSPLPIDGEKVHILSIKIPQIKHDVLREVAIKLVTKYLITTVMIPFRLIQIRNRIDIVIFYVSGPLVLPGIIVAKLLRKRVSFVATGLGSRETNQVYSNKLISYLIPNTLKLFERVAFAMVDQLAIESKSVADFYGLNRYSKKTAIYGALYIDTTLFKPYTKPTERGNVIGHIGRLSVVKGTWNLVKAIPLIASMNNEVRFLIVGDGSLREKIEGKLKQCEFGDRATLENWVPHHELPYYYNQVKLLVFPSLSEGVPGVVQEAMACGIPVLATPVGGVPDLIKDGETGFIMEDNSPECIAKNVVRALKHPKLDEIAANARRLIEEEYTDEVMVQKLRQALWALLV